MKKLFTDPSQEEKTEPILQRETIQPAAAEQKKPLEHYIHWILFWGMLAYVIITGLVSLISTISYTTSNNEELQFVKNNTEMIRTLRLFREAQIRELDTKIMDAFRQ